MKLHLDKAAFEFIIDEVAQEKHIRRDVLEKDYYVTLLLKELSEKEIKGMRISRAVRHCIKR